MKPILFSSPMVRAILNERKSMTRRIVKPQPQLNESGFWELGGAGWSDGIKSFHPVPCHSLYNRMPHKPEDILWVRETWNEVFRPDGKLASYIYRADEPNIIYWRQSIFMPKEAARIFLRVTDGRIERLQEISTDDIHREGINFGQCPTFDGIEFIRLWDSLNAKPKPKYKTVDGKRTIVSYISYPWEDIQETREFRGRPWHVCGNPWVWVYTFKRED